MRQKEPWQMTLNEYQQSLKGQRVKTKGYYNRQGQIANNHKLLVMHAIQLDRSVPKKVVLEFRVMYPSNAHKLLDIPKGKYAPRVARYK